MARARAFRSLAVCLIALVAGGAALAFEWSPELVRSGDQRYLLEVTQGEGDDARVHHVEVALTDRGGSFDVRVTVTLMRSGLAPSAVGSALFDGSIELMSVLGAASANMVFVQFAGVAGDVAVRDAPVELAGGIGRVHFEREEVVAGLTCVVARIELMGYGEMTLAVSEGVPYPCFSAYGEGSGSVRTRILEAD